MSHAKFGGHCLINNNISVFRKVINTYISLTPDPWSRDLNTDFTIRNCLLRSVKLTENSNPDKYKNTIIFEADMSSSVHTGNKNKNTLVLGEGPTL